MVRTETKAEIIRWELNYSVGIEVIDRQHHMITRMLNELYGAVVQNKESSAIAKILEGYAAYAREHVATEEKLFDDYAYPFSITHKNEHRLFKQYTDDLSRDYAGGKVTLSITALRSMSDWLVNHFISKDKPYSYFFIRRGLN